jgi:hypothetical protein
MMGIGETKPTMVNAGTGPTNGNCTNRNALSPTRIDKRRVDKATKIEEGDSKTPERRRKRQLAHPGKYTPNMTTSIFG